MLKCLMFKVWSLEWKLVSEEGNARQMDLDALTGVKHAGDTRERGGLSTQGHWDPSKGKRYRPSLRKASYGHVSFKDGLSSTETSMKESEPFLPPY